MKTILWVTLHFYHLSISCTRVIDPHTYKENGDSDVHEAGEGEAQKGAVGGRVPLLGSRNGGGGVLFCKVLQTNHLVMCRRCGCVNARLPADRQSSPPT